MNAPQWLTAELATIAWCWQLTRRDGVSVGLTSHDHDLVIGGIPFRTAPGMRPGAIELRDSFDVQTIDIEGAISSEAITAADIDAGRWDGATVMLSVVDWTAPGDPDSSLAIAAGELGMIEREGAMFSVEMHGVLRALDAPVCPVTSPGCRAALGDGDCRVALAPLTRRVEVNAIEARTAVVDGLTDGAQFAFGQLHWVSGPWTGLSTPIIEGADAALLLAQVPPSAANLPISAVIHEGCNKQLATCRDRFSNAVNFRGEPHLPGNDLLTRYPGG